jgi:hypothetical protein
MKYLGKLIFAVIILAGCSGEKSKIIQIYPEKVITKSIIGNGVQWDAYPNADAPDAEWGLLMTDKKWEMLYHRLDYMKPQLVRVMDQATWRYLRGFDNKGVPILDFDSPEIKSLQKLLDYCQKNDITVLFGEWGNPDPLRKTGGKVSGHFTGANDPRWIGIIVKYLDNLINVKGYTCLKYYVHVNEPNGSWASTNGNWDEWSEGVKILNKAIAEAGLADKISIAGPDAVAHFNHPNEKYTGIQWVEESTRQLDDYLGIYNIHAYVNYDLVRSGKFTDLYGNIAQNAKNVNKPIVFGELGFSRDTKENKQRIEADKYASEDSQMAVYDFSYGIDMADVLIQILNSGYSGAAAWDLDDAMHTLGDKGDISQMKKWGFWNILGTELFNNPDEEKIRPWFYSWSLLCRYFPKGTDIVESDSTGIEGVRLVTGIKGSDLTIAIVNNSSVSQKLNLKAKNSTSSKSFKKFIYSENLRPVDEDSFPVPQENNIQEK